MLSAAILLALLALQAVASLRPRLVPRSHLVTLTIHALLPRDADTNENTTSGLVQVSMSSDRQSYFTTIQVGGIKFRVALDTASADLWIASSNCDTDECKRIPRFPLSYQSSTFVVVNENKTSFDARYADGTVASGFLARETVQLSNLVVSDQLFGLVSESNVSFVDQTSGLLGLGFPKLTSFSQATNSTPFFPTLAQQGLLDYPLFALSLTRNNTGSLSIGAIDASVVANASDIGWNKVASFPPFTSEVNVTRPSYLQWAIPLSTFSVNKTSLEPNSTYPARNNGESLALVDIGATGIYGPFQDVSTLFSLIDRSRIVDSLEGQWAIPCDTDVPISFTFGLREYTLLPEDYIIGPTSGNPNLCLSWPKAHPPYSDGIDWQFGTAFLRTVYSIYSYGINNKEPPLIGFYPIRNETLINGNTTSRSPEELASFFSVHSATVPTTLPNFLLPTPSYSTPPYALNSSISAPLGVIVTSDLATSTYSALFGTHTTANASAIPTIFPNHSLITQTDAAGQLTVSISIQPEPSASLGIPPGWSASRSLQESFWISHSIYPASILGLLLIAASSFVL